MSIWCQLLPQSAAVPDVLARGDHASADLRSAMSKNVVAVAPSAQLTIALQVMLVNQVHHLPVVDGDRCVGLLHESDALWELCIHRDTTVDAQGSSRQPAPTIDVSATLHEVAALMRSRATDAVVVTDCGRTVGIVTATDLVQKVADADLV
jgi:CBS domain-containing protein